MSNYTDKELFAMLASVYGGRVVIAILSVILLFVFFTQPAHAAEDGDWLINANVASYHAQDSYCYDGVCGQKFNEENFGLGLTYTLSSSVDLAGGFYDNSFNKTSFYAGANFNHDFDLGILSLSPGIMVGLVTGYDDTPQYDEHSRDDVAAMIIPNVSLDVSRLRATLGYIPKINSDSTEVYMLQLGWRF